MDGTTEKDCSPLWSLYQQILADMKNSTPMWEEFISKATKLHSALKSALVAIASFLDAFQKIADAATNARGATKDIGTALTRVCLRHRAIETRMKTFIGSLMDSLITPLSECVEEWRRGCGTGALSRDHARECKRARAELRRRMHDAKRHARKSKPNDPKKKAPEPVVNSQDVEERKSALEEMEEKAVRAALVEERSRFCRFVQLLNPVVEQEVAMLGEMGHLQEGSEQLTRHSAEPQTLPAASLQVICDMKCVSGAWAESPRLSRRPSATSLCSIASHASDRHGSSLSCSTPLSDSSAANTHTLSQLSVWSRSADSGFRSQDALHRQLSVYKDNGSDNQSINSECTTPAKSTVDDTDSQHNTSSSTWPELKDAAQFERAASAILAARPHTISAAFDRQGHARAGLSPNTFSPQRERDGAIYARPPIPTRCSSLERPAVPAKSTSGQVEHKKPTPLPPHLTKEMPAAVYVNMSELATLAASRAQQQQQEKVCSESSASESSLESSSGYGSQGVFAAEDQALQLSLQQAEVECEIVTLRRESEVSRDFSVSLASLEEARSVGECETQPFATVTKPAPPKRRPLSMTASVWTRRGSSSSLGKPPPPVRRSSSISRQNRPYGPGGAQSPQCTDADNLPPPPAFLLQPDQDAITTHQNSVLETVKQLNELRHTPASPSAIRRHAGNRMMTTFTDQNSVYSRKNSLSNSSCDLYREAISAQGDIGSLSSFGPRSSESHYGQTGFKLQQEKQLGGIYAQPSQLMDKDGNRRAPSAERRRNEQTGLIATLSAKLAPQLSPRPPRRGNNMVQEHYSPQHKNKGGMSSAVEASFIDKLSATIRDHQRRQNNTNKATAVREFINVSAQPDPRVCHSSLMEQIKRGATLRRAAHTNDRSAPKIRF